MKNSKRYTHNPDIEPQTEEIEKVEIATAKTPTRLYYLDWLRVLAVLGVFYAHTLSILNLLYWHLNEGKANELFVFGTEWGMSLFFWLAGASAWFALASRTGLQFIRERFKRLVIPFIVGVLLFSPLQSYLLGANPSPVPISLWQYYPFFFSHIRLSWNPQFFAAYSFHLWFLAFLFIFSVLALVPLLYLRHIHSQRISNWMVTMCSWPGGLFLFLVPLALVQMTLRASFPNYQGWSDFFIWFLYFLYGYLLISDTRLIKAIQKQSWLTLLGGIVSLATILTIMYGPGSLAIWNSTPGYSLKYEALQFLWIFIGWSWMLFALSFGIRFLNSKNAVITYLNEAVLPFYVLHYMLIVLIAYFFSPKNVPMFLLFLSVSTISLAATFGIYEIAIRHVPLSRQLFGMKSLRTRENKKVRRRKAHV